jgi:predicted GNAT family acetyltransferase
MLEVSQNTPDVVMQPQGLQNLSEGETAEVLAFLANRPLHTFIMASFIRDNGLMGAANRGQYYGYRNESGKLAGVALVGHLTLVETQNDAATKSFAELTRNCSKAHVMVGEWTKVGQFLDHYSPGALTPRHLNRQLLMERNQPMPLSNDFPQLRPATIDDLDLVAPVHAQLAFEESGVNPLEKDPVGFKQRCARRIEKGRTWVMTHDGALKFKADMAGETPEVIYLEGIYVAPQHRGDGFGSQCLAQLTSQLLRRADSICLLANLRNHAAQKCYRKAGYQTREYYDSLYFQQLGR